MKDLPITTYSPSVSDAKVSDVNTLLASMGILTDSEKYKSGFSGGGPIKTNNIDDLLQDNTLTIKQKLDLINKSGLLTPTVGNKYESKISPTLDFYKKEDDND